MKNFDTSRKARKRTHEERTFVLGGEEFVAKASLHPSAMAGYDSIDEDTKVNDVLDIVDELILESIEDTDNAHARYRVVRENRDDPVTVEDLTDLTKWLVEIQTGRPTGPPSVSEPTPPSTVTALTAVSS